MLPFLRHLQIGHARTQPVGDGQPGGKDKGRKQGDQHGGRAQGRDGRHVRAHHAADEPHGQQRGDDGEGRQDGGVAHLGHGIHRGIYICLALLQPAPIDVLHHHDGIVHQDTDGEDQGEQADTINGVAGNPGKEDGHQQYHRNH